MKFFVELSIVFFILVSVYGVADESTPSETSDRFSGNLHINVQPAAVEENSTDSKSTVAIKPQGPVLTKSGSSMAHTSDVVVQIFIGLCIVVSFILLFAWGMKKFGFSHFHSQKMMQVIAQLPLGSRERVVLVKVSGKRLLLGVTSGQISILYVFDDDEMGLPKTTEYADVVDDSISGELNENEKKRDGRHSSLGKAEEFSHFLKAILSNGVGK